MMYACKCEGPVSFVRLSVKDMLAWAIGLTQDTWYSLRMSMHFGYNKHSFFVCHAIPLYCTVIHLVLVNGGGLSCFQEHCSLSSRMTYVVSVRKEMLNTILKDLSDWVLPGHVSLVRHISGMHHLQVSKPRLCESSTSALINHHIKTVRAHICSLAKRPKLTAQSCRLV